MFFYEKGQFSQKAYNESGKGIHFFKDEYFLNTTCLLPSTLVIGIKRNLIFKFTFFS